MRYMLRITVGVAILVACVAGRASAADPARVAKSKAPANVTTSNSAVAEKLVREALEAELAGDAAERARLLEAALAQDPELTGARWQSGQVKVGNAWLAVDEVARSNRENVRLAEYRRRRDLLVDTADGHRQLARWCQRLPDEAAVHWRAVLSFVPDDAEAIRALKLKMHNGRLLTPRELAAARAWEAREKEAARMWQPQIIKWRDAIVEGNATERQAAIDGLQSIRDPAAISTLRGAFLRDDRGTYLPELYGIYVDVLSQIPDEAATQELLLYVLGGDSEIAAPALKGRPLSSYVPQLIAALPNRVQVEGTTRLDYLPNGTITREHVVSVNVPEKNATDIQKFTDVEHFSSHAGLNPANPTRIMNTLRSAQEFEQRVLSQKNQLESQLKAQSQRIESAILASTDFERVTTREEWLAQLARALETYTPTQIPQGEPFGRRFQQFEQTRLLQMSCFPAGTPIETLTGTMTIESLKPGDRVLSQDAETGELAYQAVHEVTLRPAVPLVEIEAGGEIIRATRGHPFWVNGHRWVLAKHLEAGEHLHTPSGPLKIERIGEHPPQEAYNLVVSDFATYFVGNSKVLVHDNQPLQGTSMLVPGLAASQVQP